MTDTSVQTVLPDQFELPPADEICGKYIALRDFVAKQQAEFEERMAPYKQAMATLEAAAALLMQRTKQKALSTTCGTAFTKMATSVTCTDREAWLDFVWQQGAWEGLTSHINKEFVEAYVEQHGAPPPGVKFDRFNKVHFRKA